MDFWKVPKAHSATLRTLANPFGPENTPSGVATSVLAQVVSASSAERNWSVYGQIKPKNRSRTATIQAISVSVRE